MQRFSAWKASAGRTDGDIAGDCGVGVQTVQRWRLPPDHPRATRPSFAVASRLEAVSGGVITSGNFDDPVDLIIATPEQARRFRAMIANDAAPAEAAA